MTLTGTQLTVVEAAMDNLDRFNDEDHRAASYAIDQLIIGRPVGAYKPGADLTVTPNDAALLVDSLATRLRRLDITFTEGGL